MFRRTLPSRKAFVIRFLNPSVHSFLNQLSHQQEQLASTDDPYTVSWGEISAGMPALSSLPWDLFEPTCALHDELHTKLSTTSSTGADSDSGASREGGTSLNTELSTTSSGTGADFGANKSTENDEKWGENGEQGKQTEEGGSENTCTSKRTRIVAASDKEDNEASEVVTTVNTCCSSPLCPLSSSTSHVNVDTHAIGSVEQQRDGACASKDEAKTISATTTTTSAAAASAEAPPAPAAVKSDPFDSARFSSITFPLPSYLYRSEVVQLHGVRSSYTHPKRKNTRTNSSASFFLFFFLLPFFTFHHHILTYTTHR